MPDEKERRAEEARAWREAEASAKGPREAHHEAETEERYAREAVRQRSRQNETTGEPTSVMMPETGTRLSAREIHANVLGSAEEELERSAAALLFSAFASGLTIGLSFL